MRRIFFLCITIIFTAALAPSVCEADDYDDWSYSQKILLNTSSTGSSINRNVLKFPVLLRLNPGNFSFFSQTLDDGEDIRFAKTDGTHIPYQIERWKDGTGDSDTAEIWVRIDTIRGNNYTQSIVMYWGKANAADSSNGAAVFGSTVGGLGAWHLGGNLDDATGNGYDGTNSGSVDTASGIIGRARAFNGSSQYFHVGDLPDRQRGTLSCWFRPKGNFTSSSTTQGIWGKKENDGTNAYLSLRGTDFEPNIGSNSPGKIETKIENDNAGYYLASTANAFSANTWYYFSWSWGNNTDSLYFNGILDSAKSTSGQGIGGAANDEIGRANYDVGNIGDGLPRYFKGTLDEFRFDSNIRSADWVRISYENQRADQTLVTSTAIFTWDTSTSSGTQSGNGTWGTNNFWSSNETQLVSWPGRGYTARFFGEIDSSYFITVSGTQQIDSMIVNRGGFTFTGGTLDFGSRSGIYTSRSTTTKINSVVAGSGGITKTGRSTLVLAGTNTYTGPTVIYAGRVSTSLLADGGSGSNLGMSASDAENLIIDSSALIYTGPARSCDRLFSIGIHGGDTITANGTGELDLTNTGALGFSGSGTRRLILNGDNTDDNTLAAAVGDSGGATSLTKDDAGKWILSGACTYTGATTVSEGTLIVNGSLASGSAVTVASGATIGGGGNIAGSVTAKGAIIVPGNDGPGKLSLGDLTLGSASRIDIEMGSISDTIAIADDLELDGTVTIIPATGFAPGTYRIVTYGGELTNDSLTVGSAPAGRKCTFEYGDGYVDAIITIRLIQSEPADTALIVGQSAGFRVSASGSGTLSYLWQRSPDDSVGDTTTYSIASVTRTDNGALFRCIVRDSYGADTSRWALLTVLDTPRVVDQPQDTTVTVGEEATFTVTVADTTGCSYEWRKAGSAASLGITNSFSIEAVEETDEGDYYCSITNQVATVSTDTVSLTVRPLPPEARFGCTPKNGTAPLEISFTDSSEGVITSWHWDFGDGTGDTIQNPKHVYTAAGDYAVRLTVTGPGGVDSTDTVHVRVTDAPPVARFVFSPHTGTVPLEVSFADSSIGVITSRQWDFGDGSDDTMPNPKHTYAKAGLFSVKLVVSGPGGTDSIIKRDSVFAFDQGQNPLRLDGSFHMGTDVIIFISNIDLVDTSSPAPWCDSVGIWYAPKTYPQSSGGSTLLCSYPRSSLKGSMLVDTVTLPSTDSIFGLMTCLFWNDGTISVFSPANGCIVRLGDSHPPDTSMIRITTLSYDSMTASIRVSWCIDSAKFEQELEVGIAYNLVNAPTSMNGTQTVTVYFPCSSATVLLSEPLRFDTLYHVGLFVRKHGGAWSLPTSSSHGTVRIGHPYRQVVSFFDTLKEYDTVQAFNGTVVLWKDSTFKKMMVVDTLEVYDFTAPSGFTRVGRPFRFLKLKASQVPPFLIGIKIDSLPAGASINDVRLYRDSAGIITVQHATLIDSVKGIVYVKTNNIELPFIAMIDHDKPRVTFLKTIDSLAYVDRDLMDSVRIVDNIANIRWTFYYSHGGELPVARDSGELRDTTGILPLIISKLSGVISSEYGVRALLVVSDGVHRDTTDLSRSVFREQSDAITTVGNVWHPVYPTAQLYHHDPESLIVAKIDTGYNPVTMRLFRWVETDENGANDTDKWVEYEPGNKTKRSLFSVVPGRLLWLKTRKNTPLHLGPARTFSFKDTFAIELPSRQFTDFGMPFRFGVHIRDILTASGKTADSVQFYIWSRDTATNRYSTRQLFIISMSDKNDPSTILKFRDRGGYSLYNPYNTPLVLRIPSTLGNESAPPYFGKKVKNPSWSAKFVATTGYGSDLPALYCGYAPGLGKNVFPVSPTFEPLRIFVFDRNTGKKYGHSITGDAAGGLARELFISNASDSVERIGYRFETVGAFPKEYSAHLFDATSGNSLTDGTITIEPRSVVSRWVIVGDKGWHDRFVAAAGCFHYGLHRIYPNPARSIVNIRYSVPLGAQERLHIAIFTIMGRKVWEKRIDKLLTPGKHLITWRGEDLHHNAVGAGLYPIRLTVIDGKGKTVRRFERCLTYIP
ncbi:MAG: DUF2341 domain-containing protein [Chitinispirillaceae bacterium]|nr:DUF2341 domain-containing protein [Chitinispirillaceae bacterium]